MRATKDWSREGNPQIGEWRKEGLGFRGLGLRVEGKVALSHRMGDRAKRG